MPGMLLSTAPRITETPTGTSALCGVPLNSMYVTRGIVASPLLGSALQVLRLHPSPLPTLHAAPHAPPTGGQNAAPAGERLRHGVYRVGQRTTACLHPRLDG